MRLVSTPSNGRVDVLEAFELLQALDVGIGGGEIRHGLLIAAALRVGFLLRDRIGLAQGLIAVGIDLGQIHCGDDLLARGARLHQFLIDFRRVDVGQQLALLHAAANVLVPAQQVAVGAGVDRRLDVGLQRAGQHQFLVGLFRDGMNHGDGGNGVLLGLVGQDAAVVHAGEHGDDAGDEQHQQHDADKQQRFARRRRRQAWAEA